MVGGTVTVTIGVVRIVIEREAGLTVPGKVVVVSWATALIEFVGLLATA